VVDDDKDTKDLLRFVCESHGATAFAAENVADALVEISQNAPHVVVSDIGLPGLNGYTLIAELRNSATQGGSRPRAVALTAYATDQDRKLALESGFDAYLSKPFEPSELVDTIKRLATET
jgi:CheY-like chemotaxis protein